MPSSGPKTASALIVVLCVWTQAHLVTRASAHLPDVAILPNPKDEAPFDDKFFHNDRNAVEITDLAA